MKKAFDSYPDGDGNIIIITTDFNEYGNMVINEHHVRLQRAKQIYLTLGESLSLTILEKIQGADEEKRKDFCLWYYAQSQPLDANRIFEWFNSHSSINPRT